MRPPAPRRAAAPIALLPRLRAWLPAALLVSAFPAAAQAPDSVLAVSRAGTSLLRVNADGNVGIGTRTPEQRLTVAGGVAADSATVSRLRFSDGTALSTAAVEYLTPTLLPPSRRPIPPIRRRSTIAT